MAAKKTYSIDIELTDQQCKNLCRMVKQDLPESRKIGGIALHALTEIGDGGLVIDAKIYDQIRAIVGEIVNQQDLVKMVEASRGRRDGGIVATWRPDPTYMSVLEDVAASRGETVQALAQEIMDYVTGQGWMYQLAPETKQVFFTREQAKKVGEWLDKGVDFTGQDICNALFSKARAA
jgi:predicted RNase H-related nuclease YkuK (DUF458 family)